MIFRDPRKNKRVSNRLRKRGVEVVGFSRSPNEDCLLMSYHTGGLGYLLNKSLKHFKISGRAMRVYGSPNQMSRYLDEHLQ